MPLYKPTDERVTLLMASHGATVEVDEGVNQCYVVTRSDGTTRNVGFGATMEDWNASVEGVVAKAAEAVEAE